MWSTEGRNAGICHGFRGEEEEPVDHEVHNHLVNRTVLCRRLEET